MNIFFFFKGRVALYATLKAMGISQEDEVIVPGFTCVVVPNAILYCGAKPVYIDIESNTFNINPSLIESKITAKTKAIIAQHTFGIPANMDKIVEIAKKNNLYVIEDSCHAIGSKYKGKEVGDFGDAAFFSSQWSKPVTTGFGGWVKINNPILLQKMQTIYENFKMPRKKEEFSISLQYLLYNTFITPKTYLLIKKIYSYLYSKGIITGSSSPEELNCLLPVEYAKKMSNWQKKRLDKNLKNIENIIKHRKYVSKKYEEELQKLGFSINSYSPEYDIIYLRYPLIVKNKKQILKDAIKNGIEIGDWFVSPLHPLTSNLEFAYYINGTCPVAESICENIINLPTHCKIKDKDISKIINFIKHYLF